MEISANIKYIFFLLILFVFGCKSENHEGNESLERTIAYHDPEQKWDELKARLYLVSVDTAGNENPFQIEIDNSAGYFAHIIQKEGKEIVKGISDGTEFYVIDGNTEVDEAQKQKYELNPESVKRVHEFYGYLYGLPMKLQDKGANIKENVSEGEIGGNTYKVLEVTYDAEVGTDNWFFYLDPETYAMKAYRFNHGKQESGEYILLEQEENVEGILIPKIRKWFWNHNDAYIGRDILVKGEPLTSYRNK